MKLVKPKIEFKRLPIVKFYGESIYDVWHVFRNDRPVVMEHFLKLDKQRQDEIKDIIGKMATIPDYSASVKWRLKNQKYGEIEPWGHRFFFFIKFGKHIVFFDYREKKRSGPLPQEVYSLIEKNRKFYESEFARFITSN